MAEVSPEYELHVAPEVFALTDEQILGIEDAPEVAAEAASVRNDAASRKGPETQPAQESQNTQPSNHSQQAQSTQQGTAELAADAPAWLAERMRDPWVGDEARELWEGAQRAQRDAAAYRELFATPGDARALKEIYPGGVSEAKAAAERARQLEDFDAAYFGATGRPAEELTAARGQLAEKLYAQDPAAFREMVSAGVRILEGRASGRSVARENGAPSVVTSQDANANLVHREQSNGASRDSVSREVADSYAGFERAANAELERSVGAAISRTIEDALPNLRKSTESAGVGGRTSVPLQERLGAAVRQEVDAALKNDAQLGEQVAKVLAGKRFGEQERGQVVRLIDARARQLVPGAVRRVVGEWTRTALTARGEVPRSGSENIVPARSSGGENSRVEKSEDVRSRAAQATGRNGRRVDYGKLSDEQILEM